MCGIAMSFYYTPAQMRTQPVATMLDAIAHRGNDQAVIHHHANCVVGFRRLAITDLKENQPQGDAWKVYLNGEIYNYKELGFTGSETSVISQGLEKFGPEFVKQLNGMFFILAINGDDVFVFRDRYGIKPVYYSHLSTGVLIASEAKAIAAHPEYEFGVCEEAKRQWFTFNNVLTDDTLFEGIFKMDKGSFVHVNNKMRTTKYWNWNFQPDESMDFDFATKKIRALVQQAVKRQTPTDVQFASCLSGGIDSNIIASQLDASVITYTAGFNGQDDEREMAKLSGRENREINFTEIYAMRETITSLEDLRLGASWSNYGLFEFISKDGNKVCFDGAGADELFGGYYWRYIATDYYAIVNRTGSDDHYSKRLFKNKFPVDTLEQRFAFDANYFLEGLLLVVDKLSMAHTIEVRLPFLDNDLVDFCLTLPFQFKQNKSILKAAFADVLHPDILNGPKKGFSSPDWFPGDGSKSMKWTAAAFNEWENIYQKPKR